MTESPSQSDTPEHDPGRSTPPPAPRWVKALAGLAVLLILIVVIVLLASGDHGPGRHL
jgi:hypothetical protein